MPKGKEMKKLLVLSLGLLMLVGCSDDRLHVIHNNDRVALLEARADLNDSRDSMLEARVTSLEGRMSSLESTVADVQSDLATYQAATNAALADLSATDAALASDIADLVADVADLDARSNALSSDLSDLAGRVTTLETRLQGVEGSYPTLAARLNAMRNQINGLNSDVNSLQVFRALQVAQNLFVQLQIAALDNRIANNSASIGDLITQTQNLSTSITNLTNSTNASIADLQDQIDNIQLNTTVTAISLCPGNTATYPEQGLVIGGQIYAVYYGQISGVTQAFLTQLQPGNWVTTDGGNCHFTVNSNGTISGSTPAPSYPTGATHEMLLCGIVSYKVPGGVVVNGTTYTSNTTLSVASGLCTITNPNSNSVSSNGQSGLGGAQSCNYNGIPSVTSTTPVYQSGVSSNLCYIKKI